MGEGDRRESESGVSVEEKRCRVRRILPAVAASEDELRNGANGQGMQAASRSCKRPGNRFSARTPRAECGLADTLILSPWDLCLTSNLPTCERMDLCGSEPLDLW